MNVELVHTDDNGQLRSGWIRIRVEWQLGGQSSLCYVPTLDLYPDGVTMNIGAFISRVQGMTGRTVKSWAWVQS